MPPRISAGESHTCVARGDGVGRCWGDNLDGQLGDGTTATTNTPVAVSGLTAASWIAAGKSHSCAVSAGDGVCWGVNGAGELGDGTFVDKLIPVQVVGLAGVVEQVAAGTHSCAQLADGTVRCWGENSNGQLGDGTTTDSNVPVGGERRLRRDKRRSGATPFMRSVVRERFLLGRESIWRAGQRYDRGQFCGRSGYRSQYRLTSRGGRPSLLCDFG